MRVNFESIHAYFLPSVSHENLRVVFPGKTVHSLEAKQSAYKLTGKAVIYRLLNNKRSHQALLKCPFPHSRHTNLDFRASIKTTVMTSIHKHPTYTGTCLYLAAALALLLLLFAVVDSCCQDPSPPSLSPFQLGLRHHIHAIYRVLCPSGLLAFKTINICHSLLHS